MNSVANIRTITKRELAAYFTSPLAYVIIVIFLFFLGFFTFMAGGFFEIGQATLDTSFFRWHPWLYLVLVPAIGMRLWAEERRVGTIELLLTMPVTAWQAIVGKFLATWLFLGVVLLLTFPVVITVNWLGSPDNGTIFVGYVGSFLMAGAYLAITCVTSAITRNQVISFILSLTICLMLVLCGFKPVLDFFTAMDSPRLLDAVASFSFLTHFDWLMRGVFDSRDLIYFASIIVFSLFTTGVIIRGHRAG